MIIVQIIDVAGGQAVKLPAEFHFDSEVVSIRREGNAVILEPLDSSGSVPEAWPEGFFDSIRIEDPNFGRLGQGQMPLAPFPVTSPR